MNTVTISGGGYTAALLPHMGANLISLKYKHLDILHTPESEEELKNNPYSYGIPILCPPNKIKGAQFNFKGRNYSYPVNLPGGNHLHGVLHNAKWTVTEHERSRILLTCVSNEDIEKGFGRNVRFTIEYILSEEGLDQYFTVYNDEEYELPFGLSYHTAFNVPFDKNSSKENILLQMPIKYTCELDEELYPSLKELPLNEEEMCLLNGTVKPLEKPIDKLFVKNNRRKNIVTLTDTSTGFSVCYKANSFFKYWLAWNDNAQHGFIGIEPQTWLSNAPVFREQGKGAWGVISVSPHTQIKFKTRIFVKEENAL